MLNIPSFSLGTEVNPPPPEVCVRFKIEGSLSVRQAQAYFCSMMVPEGAEPAEFVLSCMEEHGIRHTDEDMQGFLLGEFRAIPFKIV